MIATVGIAASRNRAKQRLSSLLILADDRSHQEAIVFRFQAKTVKRELDGSSQIRPSSRLGIRAG